MEDPVKNTVLLEELSWPEVQEALDRGVRTIVIVAASIEQHGPHLPAVTDTAIGHAVGERLARILGNALLAPHGFDTFVLFSSHGGNFVPLEKAVHRLRGEFGAKGVRIISYAGMAALQDLMQVMGGVAAEMGAPQDVDAIHADVTETSIMMARHPDLVAADRLEPGYLGRIDPQEIFTRGMRAITPSGIFGDPRRANAQMGEALIRRLSEHLATLIRQELGKDQR